MLNIQTNIEKNVSVDNTLLNPVFEKKKTGSIMVLLFDPFIKSNISKLYIYRNDKQTKT
jgi:hypothetical protein